MDMLRSCYKSDMRLFRDRLDVTTPGEWHWCPEGHETFPGPHSFSSVNWLKSENEGEPFTVGEVSRGEYTKGAEVPGVNGLHRCGTEAVFLSGDVYAARGSLATDGDGVCFCCHPELEVSGDSDGGEAVQAVDAHQVGFYGDADGGEATQGDAWRQEGSGGDADDGTAAQIAGEVQLGTAGDADDGQAEQFDAFTQTGDDGDSDDGTASQTLVNPTVSFAGCTGVSTTLSCSLNSTPPTGLNGTGCVMTWTGSQFVGTLTACGGSTVTVTLSAAGSTAIVRIVVGATDSGPHNHNSKSCGPPFQAFFTFPFLFPTCGGFSTYSAFFIAI